MPLAAIVMGLANGPSREACFCNKKALSFQWPSFGAEII